MVEISEKNNSKKELPDFVKFQDYLAGARVQVCESKKGERYIRLSRKNGDGYIDFPLYRKDWILLKAMAQRIDEALQV